MEDFVVKHYIEDEAPTFKGNGFDGIRVGDDREEAQQLADYINALRKDAERYRWLRRWKGQEHEPPFTVRHELDGTLWGGDLDAAIDAARAVGAA